MAEKQSNEIDFISDLSKKLRKQIPCYSAA